MRSRSSPELKRARPLLGTFVEVRAGGAGDAALRLGIERAFERIARVHELMSFHAGASELSRLNRSAFRRSVRVSAETYAVLAAARRLSEASAGLFDVTVAPALVRWGYLPKPPAGAGAGRAAARGCWQDVELLGGRAVRFRRPLCIDLGGIAKGFAVDLAVEALRDAGIPRGAVNAGGDLRLFGGEPERVHVRLPRFPGRWVGLTTLRDGALATSAGYFDDRRKPGAEVSPWVAPASGRARARRWSVSVKAHSCTWADGLTKVLMLAGRRALPVLRSFAAEGFIVTARGEVFSSEAADAA